MADHQTQWQTQQQNIELVQRRFLEHPILGKPDAVIREVYAADAVLHGQGEQFVGWDGIARSARQTLAAFSDVTFDIEEMTAEGDRVVTRIRGTSRHTGEFRGVPPSGREVELCGVVTSLVRNGRIVEEWRSLDWNLGTAGPS